MNTGALILVLMFASLLIITSQIPLSFAPNRFTKTIGSSGTIVNPTILKHVVTYNSIDGQLADFIASNFNIVNFNLDGVGFEKIKALNPDIIMVGYRCIMGMKTTFSDWAEVNAHEDWFLHDINGNRLEGNPNVFAGYVMDVGNPGWRSHYATIVKAYLDAYPMVDGIFADNAWEWYNFHNDQFTVDRSLIPQSIQLRWHNDMVGMIQYVKSVIGSKLLIINSDEWSGDYLKYCDGQMIEGFVHAEWKGQNDYLRDTIQDIGSLEKLSVSGKIVMAHSGTAIPQNPSTSDVEQTHRVMLYCLSSFLLGYGGKANFGFQNLYTDYTGHKSYWDEMNAPIGFPTSAKYNIQEDLWARDFENGKVFLNVGDVSTFTVNVGGTAYSLAPRSGLIVPS